MPIYDQEIRQAFIRRLENSFNKPLSVIEELRVMRGNAIADLVATYKNDAHCFEIKSEADSLGRLPSQIKYYDLVFNKITLITDYSHLTKALNILPAHWGIIIAKKNKDRMTFRHYRSSTKNKNFNTELALRTLWKSELKSISEKNNIIVKASENREQLIRKISESLTKSKTTMHITTEIKNRFK